MSAKAKLISFISAFVLVLGIMIIGVISAEQVQVNIGGSVSFNATNVYAKVSGNISGAETGNKTFSTLTYSVEETTGDESDWRNLALEFTETPDPIIIKITVENLSTQRTLTVNLENTLQGEGLDIAVTSESDSYTSGTNVELPVSTGDGSSTTTFTLSLTVANPDEDLTNVTFGYILNMYDESSVPVDLSAFTFTTSGSNATLTSYTGTDAEVVIPSTISLTPDGTAIEGSDYTVTAIAAGTSLSGPFYSARSTLKSITIPETIETIGNYAFYNCTALTEINYNATNASDFSNLSNVFQNSEQNGESITVNIGENVIKLPNYMFGEGTDASFSPNITTVNFGENSQLTSIGDYAFESCNSLTSITIPSSVTSIGTYAFNSCDNLTSVDFGENSQLTSIGTYAFAHCRSLTSITIPESVTSIIDWAFAGCYALAEVYNYSSLTITAGSSSNNGDLGQYAKVVYNASDLTGEKPETRIKDYNGVRYYDDGLNTVVALHPVSRDVTTVSLDSRTTEIQTGAFYDCSNLTSVTIPSSVKSIGNSAFYGCSSLESIVMPSEVTSIGNNVFQSCSSLTSIEVDSANTAYSSEDGVLFNKNKTRLIQYPIGNTRTSYIIPENVITIGSSAFNGCRSLTSITIGKKVTGINYNAFGGCAIAEVYNYSNVTTNLPSNAKIIYNPSDLIGEKPETRITVVDNMQYYNYDGDFIALSPTSKNVTEVTLDNRTTEIQPGAFSGCTSLTSITIPDSVTSIDTRAFYNCSSLTSINFENNSQLTSIGSYAFSDCSSLTSITIPEGVTSIGNNVFQSCTSLTSITIPDSVTSIDTRAFSDCTSLTSITIPEGVISIGNYAFFDCYSLTSITINATTPPTLGGYYAISFNVANIYVPAESVDAYKAASGWSSHSSKISAIV